MTVPALDTTTADLGAMLVAVVAGEGSAAHPYLHSAELNVGAEATRNVADALHLLSLLHDQPALVELAADLNPYKGADRWLARAVRGLATERRYLAQLAVAAGPTPGTPGDAETIAAVTVQRQALSTIARSDRFGCAIGAVAGLALDWQAVRAMLDTAADRLGLVPPRCLLPDEDEIGTMLASLPAMPRLDRTLAFGARQMLVQHHGLWDLLEARGRARAACA